MAADDDLVIAPRGYDGHGYACYDDDLVDLRWGALLEDVPGLDLELGVDSLIYTDDVDVIRKGVEIIGLIAERHIRRLGYSGLLDEESGIAWHRASRVVDLRANGERYAALAEKVGWPDDPDGLDDEQLDDAIAYVLQGLPFDD